MTFTTVTSTGGRDGDERADGHSDRLLAVAAGVVSEDGRSGREQHWWGSESGQEGLLGRCRRRWLRYVDNVYTFPRDIPVLITII